MTCDIANDSYKKKERKKKEDLSPYSARPRLLRAFSVFDTRSLRMGSKHCEGEREREKKRERERERESESERRGRHSAGTGREKERDEAEG